VAKKVGRRARRAPPARPLDSAYRARLLIRTGPARFTRPDLRCRATWWPAWREPALTQAAAQLLLATERLAVDDLEDEAGGVLQGP